MTFGPEYEIPISLLLVTLLVCSSATKGATTIDRRGTYNSNSSPWKIEINRNEAPKFGYDIQGGISSAVYVTHWRPNPGWFVLIENDSNLWAFDGERLLYLIQVSAEGSTIFDLDSLPLIPPLTVLQRLPESLQKTVETKFIETEH